MSRGKRGKARREQVEDSVFGPIAAGIATRKRQDDDIAEHAQRIARGQRPLWIVK